MTTARHEAETDFEDADEESPFGGWVRSEREKKNWTQGQLAEAAGLSGQQVSNIETGRTRNPQHRTRDKLTKALGTEPPEQVITAEVKQVTIVGLGALFGFDPYDDDALPNIKGVYVLYDRTKRPVYVGRAAKRFISKRIREHAEKFWFKRPVVHAGAYLEINDEGLCKQTEQVLIKFMRTHLLLNKQGVESEPDDDEWDSF